MNTPAFPELVAMARINPRALSDVSRQACVDAARDYVKHKRDAARERHEREGSGREVIRDLSRLADDVLQGALDLALAYARKSSVMPRRLALIAHGGYGRREISPYSDLDAGLIYTGRMRSDIDALNQFLVPFLWDLGWENSLVLRTVREALDLSKNDLKVYTGYLHARFLAGDRQVYGELRYELDRLGPKRRPKEYADLEQAIAAEPRVKPDDGLYALEPNVKEGVGGLRDYHRALWLLASEFGARSLEEAAGQELLSEDEVLEVEQALDFLWRVRNELHFISGRCEDRLTYQNEERAALAFGYTTADQRDPARFMQDYYEATRKIRQLLETVGKAIRSHGRVKVVGAPADSQDIAIINGAIEAGAGDPHWFAENPSRLMSVFWESARRGVPLSASTLDRVTENLDLVGDGFRANDLVRRFFVALCSRPLQAGQALRQAAHTGLLGRYLPEFEAVHGIVRYQDFHHYPVDEHTLRAIEALAGVPAAKGAVGSLLKVALEHLSDPYVLVMALLFHDIGKVKGDAHSEEGMHLARRICQRIGLPEEDTERIAFLVRHHLLMTNIALYRDTDDMEVVESFAHTMRSEHRLRALFLLSYADLSAVGPNVWTDWKGALLLKLYLRAERVLTGQAETPDERFWEHSKVHDIEAGVPEGQRTKVRDHIRDLGPHYLAAYSASAIARQLACLAEAQAQGAAVLVQRNPDADTTDVVVSAEDHPGLFEELSGCFVSQLADVQEAHLFTRSDGMALDCFRVVRASDGHALTEGEMRALEKVLGCVLHGEQPVEVFVEQAHRRVFALLHPAVPVRTDVRFDNQASRAYSVIDVITGDRTGLLYDMARALRECGVNIASARIVTDARRVRDSFYISKNNRKIEDPAEQADIEEALRNAILARPAAELKGGAV